MIAELLLNGVAIGCVYSLIALGFVLIFKATGIVNFAQGDIMMLGSFFGLTTIGIWGMPYLLGFVVAVLATAVCGYLFNRLLLQHVIGRPEFQIIMVTIGLGYILRTVAGIVPGWGSLPQRFPTPFDNKVTQIMGMPVSEERLVIVLVTLGLMLALFVFFRFTRMGVAMQAASQNNTAATLVGISVPGVNSLVWALGAGMAGVAGILIAPITFVYPGVGYVGLLAFPAAVLGGFGSLPGAFVGGIIIGILEVFSGFYLSEWAKHAAPYMALLAVLFIRPSGLFGARLEKKV